MSLTPAAILLMPLNEPCTLSAGTLTTGRRSHHKGLRLHEAVTRGLTKYVRHSRPSSQPLALTSDHVSKATTNLPRPSLRTPAASTIAFSLSGMSDFVSL